MNAYPVRMYVIGCVLFAGCSSSGEGQANSEGQSESSQTGAQQAVTLQRPSRVRRPMNHLNRQHRRMRTAAISEDESPGAAEQGQVCQTI